jgi:hypothetical protein
MIGYATSDLEADFKPLRLAFARQFILYTKSVHRAHTSFAVT